MTSRYTQTPFRRGHVVVQGLYFVLGGLWALMGKRSFEAVTGPKVDYWLVRTVGGLLTVIGVVMASASFRDRITPETRWLAMGTSSVLATISVVYAAKHRISPIYLLDGAVNLLLLGGWFVRDSAPYDEKQRTVLHDTAGAG